MVNKIKRFIKSNCLKKLLPNNFYFKVNGFCPTCDKNVEFESYNEWLRDFFICPNCYSIPRERALMFCIEKFYPKWRDLVIHETSPGIRGASVKLKKECPNYIETQFFSNVDLGKNYNGVRNENLENQTFSDESLDLVISQDVMEHIYNPEKAFQEIARTLKKGGAHIFTVPLINRYEKSEIWAYQDTEGEPVFLKNPEYHGNPINAKGSPVTMHWGIDIINFIKEKTGMSSEIIYLDDLHLGIRAEYREVIISRK